MSSSKIAPVPVPKNPIRRNNSTPSVRTSASDNRGSGRVSMDSCDRPKYLRPTLVDVIFSSSVPTKTSLPTKSRHKKSSSSPSWLVSPPLAPTTVLSTSSANTPSLASLTSVPTVLEDEVEPLDLQESKSFDQTSEDVAAMSVLSPMSSLFFGRGSSTTSSTPAGTPPASPALRATFTNNSSVSPSPSTTPPPSPSLSFLNTWHGRLPSIPRPSPMMPFRAAKKVVTSVTSVGTGLLPSKEQLGSIPVAGRILTHPVMDSTLTYIASKTGGSKGSGSKAVTPEDVHYRKLNKKLVDQSTTLSMLAMEREEQSKTIDDEAGDDAFELYLAAIMTLMHALPFETCDPLRREAFISQLKSFLKENELVCTDEDVDTKLLRRRRRRRHREHRGQATSLIHQHSLGQSNSPHTLHTPQQMPDKIKKQQRDKPDPHSGHSTKRRKKRNNDNPSKSTLSETIVSTAVESAIRLKQSPIPDAIKTCIHASRIILSKVDEKFRLQEKAWRLSKHSIEKVIELDEQYAIHEIVTETLFATLTGLVKAGIAYKETPSYSTVKALTQQQIQQKQQQQKHNLAQGAPSVPSETGRSYNPQAILNKKPYILSLSPSSSMRRHSIIAEEDEGNLLMSMNRGGSDTSSSSCFTSSGDEDDEEGEGEEDSDDNVNENDDNEIFENRSTRGQNLFATASSALPPEYQEQAKQKINMFMALKGATSLLLGRSVTSGAQ